MHVKFSTSLQVDDNKGNTTTFSSVDVFINNVNEEDYEPLKKGITELCDGMGSIVENS